MTTASITLHCAEITLRNVIKPRYINKFKSYIMGNRALGAAGAVLVAVIFDHDWSKGNSEDRMLTDKLRNKVSEFLKNKEFATEDERNEKEEELSKGILDIIDNFCKDNGLKTTFESET